MKCAPYIMIAAGMATCATIATAQGDLCAGATLLGCGAVANGNTTAYGADVAPFCAIGDGTGGGVWYRFVGTGSSITASLCGSAYDTQIRVYSGTCAALACVVGNDDFCGLQSQVTWLSTLGTTYYILVHGYGAGAGAYTLTLTCSAPPVPMCYSQSVVPYAADPYSGTPLTLSDDVHSGVVNIGFSFCYNGTTYTQCVISSNNYVSFNLALAGTYSPWPTVPVPAVTPTEISNAILNPWQDIHPGIGGTITYQTLGVPPNRRFVVSYLNVPMYSCTTQRYSSQTVLFEGTNCIGSYILEKSICPTWNGGNAVHALHNNGGTSAAIVPGRNNTQWTASAQGLLFIPTCAPCSTSVTTQCVNLLLPIELIKFHGRNDGTTNLLEWATASEQDNDRFIVERSSDGEAFAAMIEVAAAGNSNSVIAYAVRDADPVHGTNFYRLRQIDVDGSEVISEVISVQTVPVNGLTIHPNPALGYAYWRLADDVLPPALLMIRDLAGRIVRTIPADGPSGAMDLGGLSPGTYVVLIPGRGPASMVRFTIE